MSLQTQRGGGLWLWTPYLINKTLHALLDGDYVIAHNRADPCSVRKCVYANSCMLFVHDAEKTKTITDQTFFRRDCSRKFSYQEILKVQREFQ
jgi:hypothetical protein